MQRNVLNLVLKKKWYDMIASGEKKEEYREMKPYWQARLVKKGYWFSQAVKDFDTIKFRLGYAKDAQTMEFKFLGGYPADLGKPEWGGTEHETSRIFVLKIGERVELKANEVQ